MKTKTIKTEKLDPRNKFNLIDFLDNNISNLEEGSILAISSKIVAVSQGRVMEQDEIDKEELIKREAELYLKPTRGKYDSILTINRNVLQVAAGVDESNADGLYILLPNKPQSIANQVREYFSSKYDLDRFGVLIIDSRSTPLRRGVVGVGLAYSGFKSIYSYIGKKDLFDRELKVSETNLVDSLASVANLAMGEGDESTPLVVVSDLENIEFQARNPNQEELEYFYFDYQIDLYWDIIGLADWQNRNNS